MYENIFEIFLLYALGDLFFILKLFYTDKEKKYGGNTLGILYVLNYITYFFRVM